MALHAQSPKKTRNTARNTKESVSERKISGRFNKGLRDYYTAQYEDAMQDFSGILSDAPKHAPSYFMIAKIHTARQEFSEAEIALKQAVKLDKNNIWYQIALAENYLALQDYKSATPLWEKICAEMPYNKVYLSNLCDCYTALGNSDKLVEARTRLDRLTALHEEAAPALADQNGQPESDSQRGDNQRELSVDELIAALAVDDADVLTWQRFVAAVETSGRWSELVRFEEDLTTMFPQSPDMLSALAQAFLKIGQPAKAVEYYKQALAFAFDTPQIQRIRQGLSAAYTQLGDTENAERYAR